MFWYSFDGVLIRPYFIDKFNWSFFDIIEKSSSCEFIKECRTYRGTKPYKINKDNYSDHLPIKFEIN